MTATQVRQKDPQTVFVHHGDQLLTVEELAGHLKIARRTIYHLNAEGLPRIAIRGALRYRLSEVVPWLEARGRRGEIPAPK